MRKLIASINMTLDGYCDHDAVIADEELLQNFNDLLREVDTILFGRVTYQLMENSWPTIVQHPTGERSFDEFAVWIDNVSKIVYSRTLKQVGWKNVRLAQEDILDEIIRLKLQPGKNISVGSPGIIDFLLQQGVIDEFHLFLHPIVLGKGLPLFKDITQRINLRLIKTKTLGSGVTILTYEPV